MATEATSHNLATSSTIPDHELNKIEPTSQDVPFEPPQTLVNGSADKNDNKEDNTDSAEAGGLSAEVSVSGGSDTEASKADTSKIGDDKGHARTASTVKKLASFKPVSVNKTFLAAKGVTPTAPSKLGDKPATGATTTQTGQTMSATNRPRLVAKTGSGLRDSSPRSSTPANGGKPATPDASAVWNKNRPVPPPDPKRFTDEELKQRYGIHLATRLQSDDPGRQANWADIDDDDDDWAPETIEWTDGTKITLPQADETPAPAPAPVPSPVSAVQDGKTLEAAKPKSPAPTQASASPTVKPSGFGGRAGLVLKGASEKPTLVAKPPGPPTPVKSPWAPLPPVEKVAPISIDAPQNQQPQQQNRFNQRDPHGFQGMPPPPTKEIAADDFSRSWRDGHSNAGRELYNSQSGRYEPVNDNRRGSRNETHSRQPAVLQRPSQQDGPAEPSPAFQTHRASGADSGYGRRRTSSNVSGSSGNFVRRMSRGDIPPAEMLNARRGSLAAVSDEPSSPRNFSPSGQYQSQRGNQNQSWVRASPSTSHPSPQSAHGQMAQTNNQHLPQSVVQEDPIEEQKKIMRLRREQAIKRRQEEEAREEAAKKERIRLKLEAMEREHGRLPEAKKKDAPTPKEEKTVPTQIQTREAVEPASQLEHKVNVESNTKTSQPADESSTSVLQDANVIDTQELHINGVHSGPSAPSTAPQQQNNRPAQSWQNQPNNESDRFHTWAPPPAQPSGARNVWGPPSNDRTLGNGTFNAELSLTSSTTPGAIGPPSRTTGPYQQGRGREYTARPAPIGPPNRTNGPSKEQQARVAASGWTGLPEKLTQEDAMLSKQQAAELANQRDLQAKGLYVEPPQPIIRDHWRQITINEDGTRGPAQPVSLNIIDDGSTQQKQDETHTRQAYEERRHLEGSSQFNNDPWRSATNMGASPQVRGSRFFPSNNRDIRLEDPNAFLDRPGSPSPPPPTMAGHPAYDGDSAHPHVSLPRPSPVVKLPPPVLAPIGPPKPSSFATASTSLPAAPSANRHPTRQDYHSRQMNHQEIPQQLPPVGSGGWQDRISNLLGRKSSPPKTQVLAVDSSSKNALELPTSQSFATVSLPSSVSGDLAADDGSVASKPAAEECFEEQEMGSLPVIKVPFAAPAAAWSLATPQPKALPKRFLVSSTTTIEPIAFPPHNTNNGVAVTILLPGQEESKSVTMPTARHRGSPRRGGSSRGASRHSGPHPRSGRARDTSSGAPNPSSENTSSPTSRGGHRGSSRGHGQNWNRNASAPVHT
ncbi:hypothetical protein OIDMADRAFT_104138 [Oidiodendron maius Zn]|uniref:Uncharacterized protein n=1 Tax=Oidiodendron maius (strain Zn) TaxID=913774 RepID=A0A0C3HAB4_OIDMZ|nr:hypothetical protein OIDMADRAFT_104138 [Oidiodendron maius Zn]